MKRTTCEDKAFSGARDRIRNGMVEFELPGFAVAVAKDGEILWEEAFGWADRERMIPADVNTMFCLASVSKPITATGVMKLVDAGDVDLDTPINDYLHRDAKLKVWVGDPDQVTVRSVANHTSGLPLHANGFNEGTMRFKPSMEETIRRYGNIVTAPGERYRYSNIGYGILDHLIERVSGLSYSEFSRREIFLPLGMTRSVVEITPELASFAAVRYDEENRPITGSDCDHRGASSVYCSVHDLVRFGMFHLKQNQKGRPTVIKDENLDVMRVPTADMKATGTTDLNLRDGSRYGVGWVIDDDELDFRVSHGGGMGGCASKLLMLPNEGIVVAVVANRFKPLSYTIEREILSEMSPGYADKLATYDANHPRGAGTPSNAKFQPVPELLGDWVGTVHTYQGDSPFSLSFRPDGEVRAKLGIQLWTLVNDPTFKDGWFSGKMLGNVNTPDTTRNPYHPFHHIKLDLKLRGDVVNGAAMNVSGCQLNHWTVLRRRCQP